MTSNDLTDAQKAKIRLAVEGWRTYLARLIVRMAQQGFPADDPLWLAAKHADDQLQAMERLLFTAPDGAARLQGK